jgi:SM-20-related protein
MTAESVRPGVLPESFGAARDFDSCTVVLLEELLAPPVLEWVLDYVLAQDGSMIESPVLVGPDGAGRVNRSARRSRLLADLDPRLDALVHSQLHRVLPDVLSRMGQAFVEPTAIDVQLCVSEDGDYFCAHTDASDAVQANRRLSYVLFLYREPKAFTGGRLRVYDNLALGDPLDARSDIEPVTNRLVIFPARFVHEVTEVRVPSGAFEDGRFTLNGWVRW